LVEVFVGHDIGYQIVDENLSPFLHAKIIYSRKLGTRVDTKL